MRISILNLVFAVAVVAMPSVLGQLKSGDDVERRDGTTEFDPDFALKHKRDGTTEFDPDFAL
ncbi:hypothetical protein F4824DRAFT_499057 [Ustulina deusta]|nr:hypothetical protein F4823DRAFT_387557 [Ustulina deusta]KAI3338690.1 hypothetical protein F4824DRAFT_499057 [Ustulina deusta]